MSKREKLIDRFLSKPTDFTWKELLTVLNILGYEQISTGSTSGSRVKFIHREHPPIILHRPHPRPVLKRYQLDAIIDMLYREDAL